MKSEKRVRNLLLGCLLPATVIMSGCNDDDMDTPMNSYTIKVTNVTNAQPMTPVAVVLHQAGYNAWDVGVAASDGLERLAEGGATDVFLTEANANTVVTATGVAGTAPFGPGKSVTVDISIAAEENTLLSLASMLVNTNDGFAGNAQVPVGNLSIGESMTVYSHVHDAGTEANTETAGTMPGMEGEGYNATRDGPHKFVTIHAGVVTSDDGLATSGLGEAHRWMYAASKVVITRNK